MRNSSIRRSVCPVACTLDLIGDKWTLLIIRDLLAGKTQFKEFNASPERIATNVLTDRLARLTEHGLIEKNGSPAHAGRFDYTLTGKGETLVPLLQLIKAWGLKHLPGTSAKMKTRAG